MTIRTGIPHRIMNVMPHPKPQLPSAKELKGILGAWAFQSKNHQIQWKDKRPAGAVLKDIVVQAPPKAPRTGDSIIAHVLKSDHTKVYFEKGGSTMPRFFGPVSTIAVPK